MKKPTLNEWIKFFIICIIINVFVLVIVCMNGCTYKHTIIHIHDCTDDVVEEPAPIYFDTWKGPDNLNTYPLYDVNPCGDNNGTVLKYNEKADELFWELPTPSQ